MKKLFTLITLFTLFTQYPFTQWVQQTVPVSKPITGIKFINSNTGWACTENSGSPNRAYILYTSNGGINWSIQDSVNNATYGAIRVINANTIYCGGYDFSSNSANLKKTTNGGINWLLIPTPTNMAIGDMQFLNEDSGWTTVGNVGADVRTTTNGGLNWIVRTNGIAAQTQKIFFLNYSTGFCGANFFLYKTTNAGLNWFSFYSPPNEVFSIYFLNENTGWLGLNNNRIHYTSNAGANWTSQQVPLVNSQPVMDMYFLNDMTGWAGRNTNIYLTTNGGNNWGYQIVTNGTSRLSFIDASTGWGGNFGISKTTNNGGTIFYSGFEPNGTSLPNTYKLYQNYPNPFNPNTTIIVDIPRSSHVDFIIFDILGKILHHESEELNAGSYEFKWDAAKYSSGIYLYKLTSISGKEIYSETKKMMLVK
ncbi:MAG TPA: T9SS type A sorting domain-containing protein [Ignavibacteria bacterium]|nr:T9SS type A sorting domain-containing protein [Ignavibacteria bacterium]HMR00654.1 T9SS type A sorting domain-containing protein [Ignavibacteria bacterium]